MKKTIMTSILALGVGIILVSQASASVVSERLYNQKLRIRQGVISGELSRGEAQVLKKEQRRIRKNLKKAWADGKVTRPEWRRIQILQNRASNHIYRLKHNSNSRHRVHDESHQFKYIY